MLPRTQTGRTIPYTELPASAPGSAIAVEWEFYRREAGRLLSEGNEGRFVLIKGEAVIGLFESWEAAYQAGLERYSLQPFLIHQVRSQEPVIRGPVLFHAWHASRSQSNPMA
jgi:hypothetical protein